MSRPAAASQVSIRGSAFQDAGQQKTPDIGREFEGSSGRGGEIRTQTPDLRAFTLPTPQLCALMPCITSVRRLTSAISLYLNYCRYSILCRGQDFCPGHLIEGQRPKSVINDLVRIMLKTGIPGV